MSPPYFVAASADSADREILTLPRLRSAECRSVVEASPAILLRSRPAGRRVFATPLAVFVRHRYLGGEVVSVFLPGPLGELTSIYTNQGITPPFQGPFYSETLSASETTMRERDCQG